MLNRRQIGLALGMIAAVALTAGAIIASVGQQSHETKEDVGSITSPVSRADLPVSSA